MPPNESSMDQVRTYHYSYLMTSRFAPPVGYHFFKMRAVPTTQGHQTVTRHELYVLPSCGISHATDVWGNAVQYGSYEALHEHFRVVSEGTVVCREYRIADLHPSPLYATAGALTQPDALLLLALHGWIEENCADPEAVKRLPHDRLLATLAPDTEGRHRLAVSLMHHVHRLLTYRSCVTTCCTTASQALVLGVGVCQDYAHIMIALCRMMGLPARYVSGLVIGEGETHAWVEVHDGAAWLGYDPTRDRQVLWDYIKLAHGRDASDCPLNRGQFYSRTTESFTASAQVY